MRLRFSLVFCFSFIMVARNHQKFPDSLHLAQTRFITGCLFRGRSVHKREQRDVKWTAWRPEIGRKPKKVLRIFDKIEVLLLPMQQPISESESDSASGFKYLEFVGVMNEPI